MKKNEIYKISWIDTNSRSGWWNENQIDDERKKIESLNLTTGFFIKKSGDYYIFSMSFCPVEGFSPYGMLKWIPIKTIKKIVKINGRFEK